MNGDGTGRRREERGVRAGTTWHDEGFGAGVRASLPIAIGYLGLGFAAGVIERGAGFSYAEILLLSLVVFAGSVQFVVAGLFAVSAALPAVLLAVFLVNARYLLLAAALAPLLRPLPLWKNALIGLQLTDQSYGLIATRYASRPPAAAAWIAGLQVSGWVVWSLANLAGAIAATGSEATGSLAFALPSMFAGLVVLLVAAHPRPRLAIGVVLGGAGLALLIRSGGGGAWSAVIAVIAAASLGLGCLRWDVRLEVFALIIVCALVVAAQRVLPIVALARFAPPERLRAWLGLVPIALIGAMVAIEVFGVRGVEGIAFRAPPVAGILAAFATAAVLRGLLAPTLAGVLVHALVAGDLARLSGG